jgi:cellulose synthase operon protein B
MSPARPAALFLCGLLLVSHPQARANAEPASAAVETLYDLRQLGRYEPAQLTGADSSLYLPLGLRLDRLVTRARLHLRYAYSPALLPELSHLRVTLNGETVGTLPLPRADAGRETEATLDIDPRYFSDYNQLRIQLIGHYTLQCEDPQHSSLWASISPDSSLELRTEPLRLANDLALLPAPFFDRRDSRRLELPLVLPREPELDVLRSAGVLATWFGALADYRGAHFEAYYGRLPAGHAVVLAINAEQPEGLRLEPVEQATLTLVDHPRISGAKLLLLQGRDAAQLRTAVEALVLGQAVLTGPRAVVESVVLPPRRPAYDAPRWLRTDRPVKFGELVESSRDLQVQGLAPAPLRLNVRIPPDLYSWKDRGVPLDLRYRYTSPLEKDNSLLSISINDEFIQAVRLRPQEGLGDASRLLVPLLDTDRASRSESLTIPAFRVGADNQLQFQFALDYHREGLCQGSVVDLARAGIDPDSSIDFSGFPHYTVLPNLALFANAGFPFSKYADLAETLVVLPDAPDARAVSEMLQLLGRLGRQTGAPGLRVQLSTAAALPDSVAADLLVIAGGGRDLLGEWLDAAPVRLDTEQRSFRPSAPAPWYRGLLGLGGDADESAGAQIQFRAQGPVAALLGFESPLAPRRSVVMMTATTPDARQLVLDALQDGGLVREIRGDTVLVRGREVLSQHSGRSYGVGDLSWTVRLWVLLSRHPLLIVLFVVVLGLLGALFVNHALRAVAARRLNP